VSCCAVRAVRVVSCRACRAAHKLTTDQVLDLLRIWGTPLDKHLLDKEWPNWDNDFDGLLDWTQYKRLFEVLLEKHTLHG